jgi:hypothetical protein
MPRTLVETPLHPAAGKDRWTSREAFRAFALGGP